ncbi:MAG: hypothetical protein K6F75_13685 [Butyrivibrio sp.]|nr:hypothetical protein [Butyrivibrio sp.]
MSTNFFSSLSGNFDYVSSMSGLLSDYSSIKNGSYGTLMKSYVNKVGNKTALNAYRETGSTTTGVESATGTSSKSRSVSKSGFLDSYLKEATSTQDKSKTSESTSTASSTAATSTTSTDKYAKYKSSWLDDQLKQYDKDANKTTAADTSVAYDTTI